MDPRAAVLFALAMLASLVCAASQDNVGADVRVAGIAPQALSSSTGTPDDDIRRGWHFFIDPEPDVPEEPPRDKPVPPPRATRADADKDDLRNFEALQKRLEDYRKIAVLNPTERNVRRYMEMEHRVYRMAGRFSQVSQRVAWSTPELDMSLQGRPINARAIDVFDRTQATQRQDAIAALARTHVLFLFFRSDCPYCHAFAPTVRAFEQRFGLKVIPVSLDGRGIPDYPNPRPDNGIATTLKVTQTPALFLAEPSTRKIIAIGFGVLSESELVERIATVAAPGAESLVPSATRLLPLP